MSERKLLRLLSSALLVVGVICAIAFVLSGFSLVWMVSAAICLVGSFMSFLVSFAA
jgi:hypothetical protein